MLELALGRRRAGDRKWWKEMGDSLEEVNRDTG
jgi:hypothetical protein